MLLRESYAKVFPFEAEHWKIAVPVSDYLREKYNGGEPSAMFAAFRKEAVKRKAAVKHGEALLGEFTDWLRSQQDMADRLMDDSAVKMN